MCRSAAALMMLAISVTACSRSVARNVVTVPGAAPTTDGLWLRVENNTDADMNIFVLSGGVRTSIGFVAGGSAEGFELGGLVDQTGAPLRIFARPVGGKGLARSDPLTARVGQTVTFTIQPDLVASFATVR
jgi:hypothetical protein